MTYAIPVRRGCGVRQQGGVYAEVGFGPGGRAVEDFLIDPPKLIDEDLHVAALGTQLVTRGGVCHVVDKVGREHYPNVADFIEEVRRFGLSRRLSSSIDFSRLTPQSCILLAHDRAYVENWTEYKRPRIAGEDWHCPKHIRHHAPHICEECCAGLWWQDVEGGEPSGVSATDRDVLRAMPSFSYPARRRPHSVRPIYAPAFFACFPLGRLAVVMGNDHGKNLERARKARIRVDEVEE